MSFFDQLGSLFGDDKKKELMKAPEATFGGFEKSNFEDVGFSKSNFEDVSFDKAPANALGQDLSGMGIANNVGASMPDGVAGSVPMSPMQQQAQGQLAPAGPDWKGMAKDLGKGMTAFQESQKFTTAKPAQLLQQAQAPQTPPAMGMAAQAQQPQMSTGMQAIMGNIPEEQRRMGIFGMLGRR